MHFIYNQNLTRYFHEGQAFLNKIITGDETNYIIMILKQNNRVLFGKESPILHLQVGQSRSVGKVLAVFFFDWFTIICSKMVNLLRQTFILRFKKFNNSSQK